MTVELAFCAFPVFFSLTVFQEADRKIEIQTNKPDSIDMSTLEDRAEGCAVCSAAVFGVASASS